MTSQTGRNHKFARALILLAMPIFTACKTVEVDAVETESNLIDNSRTYGSCISWTAYYEDPASCGRPDDSGSGGGSGGGSGPVPPPPPPNTTGNPPPPSGSGVAALINDELESNDTLANANVMRYSSRTNGTTHIGWVASGSIDDLEDLVDYFVFTAPVGRDYVIRLCPPLDTVCTSASALDTLTAFFEFLDQDGNVLLSSQGMPTNAYEMSIDAGVAYTYGSWRPIRWG